MQFGAATMGIGSWLSARYAGKRRKVEMVPASDKKARSVVGGVGK